MATTTTPSYLNSTPLTSYQTFGLRVRVAREVNHQYLQDKKRYAEEMSEYRIKHREDYWNVQTQSENLYLQQFREERTKKQQDDMDRWRTNICTISGHTQEKLNYLAKKEKKLLEEMRRKDITKMKTKMDKKLMIDAMQMEADKSWPTMSTLDERVNADVIIPQTILNYGEYQSKLQKLAMYAEQGNDKAMQDILDNTNTIQTKNKLLQPIFRDIKSRIRHMTHTPEFELMREYVEKRNILIDSIKGIKSQKQQKEVLFEFRRHYAKLLALKQQEIIANETLHIDLLLDRLNSMHELLSLWSQYVEIIYMPEVEADLLQKFSQSDSRVTDMAYQEQLDEKEVQVRLNTLFGSDQLEKEMKAAAGKLDKEEDDDTSYKTVNEDETTDTTTDGEEDKTLQGASASTLALVSDRPQQEVDEHGVGLVSESELEVGILSSSEDEGILSSDQEEDEAQKPEEVDAATVAGHEQVVKETTAPKGKPIHQFREKSKSVYGSNKKKEKLEHEYSYSEVDLDKFEKKASSQVDTHVDAEEARATGGEAAALVQDEEEFASETNYAGTDDLAQEIAEMDTKVGDMKNLNLFGIDLDIEAVAESFSREKGKQGRELKRVLNDLVNMASTIEEEGEITDFKQRNAFNLQNPYSAEHDTVYGHLRYEDDFLLRASLVVHVQSGLLAQLEKSAFEGSMSNENMKKLALVRRRLTLLHGAKILEAPVLLKLFKLYRCRPE